MNETLAKALLFAGICLILILAVKAVKGLWRAARSVKADTIARTAGALTGAAETHAAQWARSFRDGRGH